MGDTRTDSGQYYPGGKVVARHDVAPPQIVVQWSDVQGKPQIAPLPERYRESDVKGKINEIASKFATALAVAIIGWTAFAGLVVQKARKDTVWNDGQIVTNVYWDGDGPQPTPAPVQSVNGKTGVVELVAADVGAPDTNAVREIVRDEGDGRWLRTEAGAAGIAWVGGGDGNLLIWAPEVRINSNIKADGYSVRDPETSWDYVSLPDKISNDVIRAVTQLVTNAAPLGAWVFHSDGDFAPEELAGATVRAGAAPVGPVGETVNLVVNSGDSVIAFYHSYVANPDYLPQPYQTCYKVQGGSLSPCDLTATRQAGPPPPAVNPYGVMNHAEFRHLDPATNTLADIIRLLKGEN